jgi:hypothetical protein
MLKSLTLTNFTGSNISYGEMSREEEHWRRSTNVSKI